MGLFKSSPDERAKRRAEKQQRTTENRRRREEEAFSKTPAGKARAAKAAGMEIFQIDVPLSKTKGETVPMVGAFAHSSATTNYAVVIQSIEAEGWRLEHAGYIYRVTESVSRDKFLSSGQQEAVSGEIVGIYIFRAISA